MGVPAVLSHPSIKEYTPFIVLFVSLLFFALVFVAIKLVYMTHRRTDTINTPPTPVSTVDVDKQGSPHRGLLVGCLGSPAWETNANVGVDGAQRRRSSFAYQLHTRSTRSRSKYSGSGSTNLLVSDAPLGRGLRRASSASIRLVDGPSQSKQVEYAFLSALPPNTVAASPQMRFDSVVEMSPQTCTTHTIFAEGRLQSASLFDRIRVLGLGQFHWSKNSGAT